MINLLILFLFLFKYINTFVYNLDRFIKNNATGRRREHSMDLDPCHKAKRENLGKNWDGHGINIRKIIEVNELNIIAMWN